MTWYSLCQWNPRRLPSVSTTIRTWMICTQISVLQCTNTWVRSWSTAELRNYIPHLNTFVSPSQTGLLSPTHESSTTCYLIKTHCPFLCFDGTSLSTLWSAVPSIPIFSYSQIFNFISCECNITVFLSLLSQHQFMNSYCWYALSLLDCVGVLCSNSVPQGGQPKSKKRRITFLTAPQETPIHCTR